MKTIFRFLVLLSLIVGICAAAPQAAEAQAQTPPRQQSMSPDLEQAFLAASAQPFAWQGVSFTTQHRGLSYVLNNSGLYAQSNGLQWGVSLRGMGRGADLTDVAAPEILQTDTRLEYRRGAITEWYRDTAVAVEHGFDIAESPKGNGKLVLHLDLSTDLDGKPIEDATGLAFAGPDGQTLRYDGLAAHDANGVALDARFIYNPAQIVIQVDDREAAYPITIDPLLYIEQKVVAPEGALSDEFGTSVALGSDVAVIGAPHTAVGGNTEQGAAYVFVRSGNTWHQQARLVASDGAVYDHFGTSVAISVETIIIGAPGRDYDGSTWDSGAAYVFVRDGSTWTQQARFTGYGAYDALGTSVAIAGDTAIVGAPYRDVGGAADRGEVWLFTRMSGAWSAEPSWVANDGTEYDYFGMSVAMTYGNAVVGAPGDASNRGAAYVFYSPDNVSWWQQARLTATDGLAADCFGDAVDIEDGTALVGAPFDDVAGVMDQGSAYVFMRDDTNPLAPTWSQYRHLSGSPGGENDRFGTSVALGDYSAAIGAPFHSGGGSTYMFSSDGINWTQVKILYAADESTFDRLGTAADTSGRTILAGAPAATVGYNPAQGAAYFYQGFEPYDVAVSFTGSPSPTVLADEPVRLTIGVTNYGPEAATAVLVALILPQGLNYVSMTPTRGTISGSVPYVSWDVGDLPLGVQATLLIDATVQPLTGTSRAISLSAVSTGADLQSGNSRADLALTLKRPEHLTNGGFNSYTGTSKIPTGWTASRFASSDGKSTVASSIQEGTASLKIGNTTAKVKTLTQLLPSLSGSDGDVFFFSYWVKGNKVPKTGGLCQAQVILYAGTTVRVKKTLPCGSTGTFGYRQKTVSFTVPTSAVGGYTSAKVIFTYSKPTGAVWFDGASLVR